jgi:hypothetical protein
MIKDVIQKTRARMEKAVEDLKRAFGRPIRTSVDFFGPHHVDITGLQRR